MKTKREYSDPDYEELTEIYFKNEWIRKGTNFEGFEDLWFDFDSKRSKYILKRLISNFKYIEQEEAKIETKKILKSAINEWGIKPEDTLFIAFKLEDISDGSGIILNFVRPILKEIDKDWSNKNLYTDLNPGLLAASKIDGIKNIVLIDDFVGTGSTAINRINITKDNTIFKELNLKLFVFSLGGMKAGKKLINEAEVDFVSTYLIDKGTTISFPADENEDVRKDIIKMEQILYNKKKCLEKYSLGYEKSEALYSWNVFNIPNNNFSIFWWNRYKNGDTRKTMFTRS